MAVWCKREVYSLAVAGFATDCASGVGTQVEARTEEV